MDNRFKQLAVSANPPSQKIYESDSWKYNCAAWSVDDLEKFTKLIVKECSTWVNDNVGLMTDEARTDLLKHFGVKE